jgi:hypothetical protein
MFRDSSRYLIVVVLLLLAAGAWLVISQGFISPPGSSVAAPGEEANADPGGEATHLVIVDVEGWYRRTSYERALGTAVDFTLRADLFEGIPEELGPWRSEGRDSPMGPTVDEWYDNPEVAMTRAYSNGEGSRIYFSIIGSRGGKSFHLFEHTALTCYPGGGWRIVDLGLEDIAIGDSSVSVQRVIADKNESRRVVLYWYLWTDPERRPDEGILSLTLHANVDQSDEETSEALKEFFRLLFPTVMPWRRFG